MTDTDRLRELATMNDRPMPRDWKDVELLIEDTERLARAVLSWLKEECPARDWSGASACDCHEGARIRAESAAFGEEK